jgi:hypothetical protein
MKIWERLKIALALLWCAIKNNAFIQDTKAEINRVIGIVIALYVAGALLPSALLSLAGGNYTGVDPAVKTITTVLLPILAVLGIALIFLAKKKSGGGT